MRAADRVTGWLALLVAASVVHARERRRLVRVARARHEVSGPLCTAQVALEGLEPSARVEAIGLELRRAALALDDLATPRRRRGPLRRLVAPRRRRGLRGWLVAPRRRCGPLCRLIAPRPSRPAAGPRSDSRVDVARLLADAAPVWRSVADARGVELAVEPAPAAVAGDGLRLAQACANLVTNAVEHGGGAVKVRSSATGGRVRIEVADLGPGLPAPLPKLVAAAQGRRSPRGHGLAIAAAIAERHGGRLTTVHAPRGARVALDLPAA